MKTYNVEIVLANLIMHNGQTADPTNAFAKAMKEISGKRKKVDADFEAMAEIEYKAGLYLNKAKQVVLPSRSFEAMIAEGARTLKEGKTALSSTIVENDAVISYDGGPLTVEELVASPDHRMTVAVRVGTAKVMRTRPYFENVRATFQVALADDIAQASQLKAWIEAGLSNKGLGDWRPRYGRGHLVRFEEARLPMQQAA